MINSITSSISSGLDILQRSVDNRLGLNKVVKFVSGSLSLAEYTSSIFGVFNDKAFWVPSQLLKAQLRQVVDVTDLANPLQRANEWFGNNPFWVATTKVKALGKAFLFVGHLAGFVDTLRNWGVINLSPWTLTLSTLPVIQHVMVLIPASVNLGVIANAGVFGSAVFAGMFDNYFVMQKSDKKDDKIQGKLRTWEAFASQIDSANDAASRQTLGTAIDTLVQTKKAGMGQKLMRRSAKEDRLHAEIDRYDNGQGLWFIGGIIRKMDSAKLDKVSNKIEKLIAQQETWGRAANASKGTLEQAANQDDKIRLFQDVVDAKIRRWTHKKLINDAARDRAKSGFYADFWKAALLALVIGKDTLGWQLKGSLIILAFLTNASSWWKTVYYDLGKKLTTVDPEPNA